MGYIKHNAIVVTGWHKEKVLEARNKAIEIFEQCFNDEPNGGRLVSEVVSGLINEQYSFFIAPDGSKEGWNTSENGNEARRQFWDWLRNEQYNYCDYVEIRFSDNDEHKTIVRSKDSDIGGI